MTGGRPDAARAEGRLLDLEVSEDGGLHRFCGRASSRLRASRDEEVECVFETAIIGLTKRLVHVPTYPAHRPSARTHHAHAAAAGALSSPAAILASSVELVRREGSRARPGPGAQPGWQPGDPGRQAAGPPPCRAAAWRGTQIPSALADLVQRGGCAVFASAAACIVGNRTLPVYEVYKVGQAPRWLEGLDLVGAAGLPVAIVPHYDNAEGGTPDTRFCYMGDRRLVGRHLGV